MPRTIQIGRPPLWRIIWERRKERACGTTKRAFSLRQLVLFEITLVLESDHAQWGDTACRWCSMPAKLFRGLAPVHLLLATPKLAWVIFDLARALIFLGSNGWTYDSNFVLDEAVLANHPESSLRWSLSRHQGSDSNLSVVLPRLLDQPPQFVHLGLETPSVFDSSSFLIGLRLEWVYLDFQLQISSARTPLQDCVNSYWPLETIRSHFLWKHLVVIVGYLGTASA